jgi:nucleoside 2-deoxyribosyltransferase
MHPVKEAGGGLKVYLAGPDIFFPSAQQVGLEKKRICADYGFEGLFPLDNGIPTPNLGDPETAEKIFRADCELMDAAHFVIANMMPFRGVSTDAGTAFEIGYLYAQQKPVFGYGSDGLTYLERVLRADSGTGSGALIDRHGMHIEDFDLTDNLMLVCAVRRWGLDIVNREGEWSDLSAFRECVRLAAERLPLLNTSTN